MAAKGSILKEEIIQKILETFPGSFKNDKEIRIVGMENGEELQIKVALTCAKVNVSPGADVALPGAAPTQTVSKVLPQRGKRALIEPTAEEKQNVSDFLKVLGL
jgi:hypothetical protein